MIKVLFVCLGNICRSPMAEFVLKDMVEKRGMAQDFYIASAATSTEEIGNPVHHGTRRKLAEVGISTAGKYAVQVKKSDYDKYDYLLLMDSSNLRNIHRIIPSDPQKKIHLLRSAASLAGRCFSQKMPCLVSIMPKKSMKNPAKPQFYLLFYLV